MICKFPSDARNLDIPLIACVYFYLLLLKYSKHAQHPLFSLYLFHNRWLNEGFASWAENWAADHIYPQWNMWDQFTTGHLSAAMRLDALKSSHPIQVPIHHAEEVEEVFDAIS